MKKALIIIFSGALILAGLTAIITLMSGSFDGMNLKILITTLVFTVYSILGLCCNAVIGRPVGFVGVIGLALVGVGLIYALYTTWFPPDGLELFLKLRVYLLAIAIAFAHASLILLIKAKNSFVGGAVIIALICNVFATLLVLSIISSIDNAGDVILLLGVVSIVGVVATILAPMMNKFSSN